MDKIYVTGMKFYGYHGVFKEEKTLGQRFNVDLIVELDTKKAGETDDLAYSVSYADLFKTCEEVVQGKPYDLVESVAEEIAKQILNTYELIQQCTVKVIKPDPPIPGHYDYVAVEIIRGRI
jgi:7,8-dihydroneopterin aldolase/epimerase/oxygenase